MRADRFRGKFGRIVVVAILALVWLGGCGEGTGPDGQTADSVIVSNPVPFAAAAGFSASLQGGTVDAANEDLVFVALEPGTVPDGQVATVRKVGATNTVTASIIAGGLDPVPVVANAGDNIEVVVTGAGSAAPISFTIAVPTRRRPVVVRADPPPRKRDVPLNTALVLVFNEPVDSGSLGSAVQLFHGSTRVPGRVELLGGTATAAVFRPDVSLDANTDYRLVASTGVRDLTGDPLAASVTVEFTTGQAFEGAPNSIVVVPDTSEILVGSQVQVMGSARDSAGNPVHGVPFLWVSDSPSVASVSEAGLVTALAAGVAHISGGGAITGPGVATVFVVASQAPVDSIALTPDSAAIPLGPGGGTVRLSAVLRDSAGNVLTFRQVQWRTSNPAIATVAGGSGGKGLVTGIATGTVTITASSESHADSVSLAVVQPGPFARVLAGGPDFYNHGHSCGVTTDGWVLCWGVNQYGQAGTGIGGFTPLPVGLGGIQMSDVDPSGTRSCGLTSSGAAYCWGSNMLGGLGIGSPIGPESCFNGLPCSWTPLAVAGGHQFKQLDVGGDHACALTTTGAAYCWGYNDDRLGIGTSTGPQDCSALGYSGDCSPVPIAVVGSLTFTSITVGESHSCGLTASGAAYCWGHNDSGQLGDSSMQARSAPVAVAGGHAFVTIAATSGNTCGLLADGTAYCWGANGTGELGIGTTGPGTRVPVPVATSLRFSSLWRGSGAHLCAIATDAKAYCWGYNEWGQLGTGNTQSADVPTAVAGGLSFANISVALFHSCGVTLDGLAYCWGDNAGGQLGTGSFTGSLVPVKVAGPP